jgi:hypothetical protein
MSPKSRRPAVERALESDQSADQQRTEHTYDHDELFVAHSRKGNLNPDRCNIGAHSVPPCFETAQIMAARSVYLPQEGAT